MRSRINRNVPLAQPDEFVPLELGPLHVWPPVVLAPMAGITNAPFRNLCRRFGAGLAPNDSVGGLYVSEMVVAHLLAARHPQTLKIAAFAPDEIPRSLQLYGVDPTSISEAVSFLVNAHGVDHIDLNFGCPVRKVTKRGGGVAIPLKPNLLRKIVRAAVQHAGDVPVTIKFRIGINQKYQTFLAAGKIAEEEGCAAVGLHARTAAQLYQGRARWEAIARLKEAVTTIPVLGNGDIWEGHDALRMMRATGCDGVIVGRGCLGRPWLFRDLADVFNGREPQTPPTLGSVIEIMMEHARLLCQWEKDERIAMISFRKHCTWYVKGFPSAPLLMARLSEIDSLQRLWDILAELDPAEPFPRHAVRMPRGKKRGKQRVALPPGYLNNLDDDTPPTAAGMAVSGG